ENTNRNAKKKVSKLLSVYDMSFNTTEVMRFKDKLRWKAEEEEHRVALRMKAVSTCTIEDLKHLKERSVDKEVHRLDLDDDNE
ncbi:35_t:CDS:2, partial [Paraglomus occultum]